MSERLECEVLQKARYIIHLPFTLLDSEANWTIRSRHVPRTCLFSAICGAQTLNGQLWRPRGRGQILSVATSS